MPARHFNIADLFEIVADTVPEREALVCGEARLTYAELEQRANRLAHFLAAQGIGAGDKVGLYLYNCNEYLEGMLACFKVRAVPVNVNYRYVEEELRYLFDNADMAGCIHHREFAPRIAAVRAGIAAAEDVRSRSTTARRFDPATLGASTTRRRCAQGSPARDFGERSDDDIYLLYTGGTTGMPKGVMWRARGRVLRRRWAAAGTSTGRRRSRRPRTSRCARRTASMVTGMALRAADARRRAVVRLHPAASAGGNVGAAPGQVRRRRRSGDIVAREQRQRR